MPSAKPAVREIDSAPLKQLRDGLQTSGDLRRVMKNVLVGLMHGDMKPDVGAACIKACEQINVSLYSEIKHASILLQMGRQVPELGELPLFGRTHEQSK
jgi:isopentenyl phosphate kinase